MRTMKAMVLGVAVAAAAAGLGATKAEAAQIGVYVRGGAAYVPPCPGPGYAWVDGYWDGGYWVPGYWNFVGGRMGRPIVGGAVVIDRGPRFVERDRYYGRDYGRDHGWDRDHFRR